MPKNLLSMTSGVLLFSLLLIFSVIAWNRDPQGVSTQQTASGACLTASDAGFVFAFDGYVHNEDGTTTLTYSVTNPNKKDISYVAFGTADWTRVEPSDGITTTLELGTYQVEWTNDHGNPGFTSVKYETQFGGFSKGAVETFTMVVSDFDSDVTVQVEAKAGRDRGLVSFALDDPACDTTPPTPTPTPPFSPLPTPTPTPEGGVVLPTEPVVAECVFGPPAGGMPPDEPIIPLSAYSFSEPTLVLTNTAPIGIQQWLPDSETLMVTRHTGYGNKLELINVQTLVLTELLAPNRAIDAPQWLTSEQTVAWREFGAPGHEPGYWVHSFDPPGERRLSADGTSAGVPHDRSPDGTEFVFMSLPGGTQPLIWNQETKRLRSLSVDLNNWRYRNGPIYRLRSFNINWQPSGDKILFWDGSWAFLYDLAADGGCEIRQETERYLRSVSWSPNGRYLLTKIGEHLSSIHPPHDLIQILDTYTGESTQYSVGNSLYSFSWAPDNQTVAIVGDNEQKITFPDSDIANSVSLYLFNIQSGEYEQILSNYFAGAIQGMAWSPDGRRLAFLGSPLDNDVITGTGGVYVSQVTRD